MELSDEDLADKNLVRFLRARNGNVDAAELMIRNVRKIFILGETNKIVFSNTIDNYITLS